MKVLIKETIVVGSKVLHAGKLAEVSEIDGKNLIARNWATEDSSKPASKPAKK